LIEKLEAQAQKGDELEEGDTAAEKVVVSEAADEKDEEEKQAEYHEDAEAFDDSSEEEEKLPAKPEAAVEELKPEVPHPADLFKKGNLVELEDVDPIMFIGGRKEVKNASLVRNFIS